MKLSWTAMRVCTIVFINCAQALKTSVKLDQEDLCVSTFLLLLCTAVPDTSAEY